MADFTQAQLDAINEAISSGTLSVKYQDKEVTYRSLEELLRIRDTIKKALGQSSASSRLKTNFKKSTDCE